MRFKVDENLPGDVAEALRAAGHDACTVLDQSMSGAPDHQLAEICAGEGRVLITLDLDFGDIRRYPPEVSPGIIIFRPASQDKASVIKLANRLLGALETGEPKGSLWLLSEEKLRVRGRS